MQRAKITTPPMPEDAPPLAFRIKAISATLRVPLMTVYAWKNSDVRPLPSETIGSSIFVREKQLVFWLGQHHPIWCLSGSAIGMKSPRAGT